MNKILVFDSGCGGISILNALEKTFPTAQYQYLEDTENFPYGDKDKDFIQKRVISLLQDAYKSFLPDIVVVACNTASLYARQILRETMPIPIICLEPAIKPAIKITKNANIGLLVTPATLKEPSLARLIGTHVSKNIKINLFADKRLAEIAEKKFKSNQENIFFPEDLKKNLKQTLKHSDTLILGCTHYHLLKEEFSDLLPEVKFFVDPTEGVIKRVKSILETRNN